jgi:uncharacterized RDD family membrane protein YckC
LQANSPEWRQEIANRLHRYQARRKPRPPRYPSLQLRFEEVPGAASNSGDLEQGFERAIGAISDRALAVDQFAGLSPVEDGTQIVRDEREIPRLFPDLVPEYGAQGSGASQSQSQGTARIIEFPRSWTPALPPADELAEPVVDAPRILEAPAVVPPPPALGGITIEPTQALETAKWPGIDVPSEDSHAGRRMLAVTIDGIVIAAACSLFGFIFWKITAIRPPRLQIVGVAGGLAAVFWSAYQYLLIVYAGVTPGLRLAGLRLARFDGNPANRRLRRWRVLASFLSAASLGMGYAWVFLDEDALCWHDRITRTYLAAK